MTKSQVKSDLEMVDLGKRVRAGSNPPAFPFDSEKWELAPHAAFVEEIAPVSCSLKFLALSISLSLFAASSGFAEDEMAAAYQRAADASEAGEFTQSRNILRGMIKEGEYSEQVFVALGGALFRLGDYGEATLAYRRAQFLDPRMVEAAQNLEVVEKKVGFLKFEYAGIDGFLAKFSKGELIWLISIGAWVATIALAIALIAKRLVEWRPLLFVISVFGAVLAICAGWAYTVHGDRLSIENRAIITGAEVEARVAPTPDAEAVITLPPGTEVRRVVRRGAWDYIEIPGNLRGWIRGESAKIIWPIEPAETAMPAT